ncbi:MAG TPA: response regulator [Longimicrobiaceae bacterium]
MTEPTGEAGDPGAPEARPVLPGTRVLVVEDDEFLRDLVEELLRDAGARAVSAPDAEAAAARLEAGVEVDVVLTDLHLPGESGFWLAEWCEARAPGLPVVVMSAALPPGGSVFPRSVRRYVRKPFTPGSLLRAVEEAVRPPGPGR